MKEQNKMKKILNILAVLTFIAVGLTATASAQRSPVSTKTKIDFDFYVGNKLLPAGEYRIRLLPASSESHKLIVLHKVDGDESAIIPSVPENNKGGLKSGSVKFNKVGDAYFLSGVQLGDESLFQAAIKGRTEKAATTRIANLNARTRNGVVTEIPN